MTPRLQKGLVRLLCAVGLLVVLAAFAPRNLITGDGGRTHIEPDMTALNLVRVIYGSEGGFGEAYYPAAGRIWARWETDFPLGDENFAHRLAQLTRIRVNPTVASRFLTAPDLGDYPLLFMSDPGWMVLSNAEKDGLRRYLARGGMLWVDDFWGDAEWRQFESVMREVLPGREWQALNADHPIFHQAFDLDGGLPQIPALEYATPGGPTMERGGGHKEPMGPSSDSHLRAWLDDEGHIMVLATHNTDVGDGWEREAYGEWYFETFSTKSYMVGVNVLLYAMTH